MTVVAKLKKVRKERGETIFTGVFPITGLKVYLTFYKIKKVVRYKKFYLKRDEQNRYDKNATGVFVDTRDFYGEDVFRGIKPGLVQIGWIPKKYNTEIAEILDKNEVIYAGGTFHSFDMSLYERNHKIVYPLVLKVEIAVAGHNDFDHSLDALRNVTLENYKPQFTLKKEKEKTMLEKLVEQNTKNAKKGAMLEASNIANNKLVQLAEKQAPMMVRGYVNTPVGRVVLANLFLMAVQNFKPNNLKLKNLSENMVSKAYEDVFSSFNIEALLDSFIDSGSLEDVLGNTEDKKED